MESEVEANGTHLNDDEVSPSWLGSHEVVASGLVVLQSLLEGAQERLDGRPSVLLSRSLCLLLVLGHESLHVSAEAFGSI